MMTTERHLVGHIDDQGIISEIHDQIAKKPPPPILRLWISSGVLPEKKDIPGEDIPNNSHLFDSETIFVRKS